MIQRFFVVVMVCLALTVAAWQCGPRSPAVEHIPGQHHPELVGSVPRSPCWRKARAAYIADHPDCAACGTTEDCEVHHVRPFAEIIADPATAYLECHPSNLITLCRRHHFELGHCCQTGKSNWGLCSNPNVREDAEKWRREHRLPPAR